MGTSLSGLTPATTFDGLLKVGDNDPLTAGLKAISDGSGNDSAIQLSTSELKVMGQFNVDTDTATTEINLRGDSLIMNQVYQANEVTYNSIQMINSSGIRLKNGTGTALLARGGNIGIGGITTTPTARLQVKGSGTTSATTSLLVQNSLGDNVFSIKDNGLFTFNDAGGGDALTIENGSNISQIRYNDNLWLGSSHGTYVPTLKIDRLNGLSVETNSGSLLNLLYDTGNLGIGETTPTARLHIKGSGNDNTTTSLLVQNSDGDDALKVTDDKRIYIGDTISDVMPSLSLNGFASYAHLNAYSSIDLRIRNNSALSINSTKKIGINTTTPTAQLQVKGSGNDAATTALLVENSDGTDALKVLDDGNVQVAEYIYPADGTTNSRLRVSNSSGTYMYYSTGNLKLNPNLVYTSTTYGTVFSVSNSTGDFSLNGATGAKMAIKGNGATSATTALLVENSAGTDIFKVNDAGQATASGSMTAGYFSAGTSILGSAYARVRNTKLYPSQSGTGINIQADATNNPPDASAVLQADSTTQGFLPPRMTDAERDAIATPAAGLMIYDTTNNQMNYWNGSTWIAF